MRLVSSGDLRARLGLGDLDSFVLAADNASGEATLHLESDLRTPLLQASYSDLFLLDLSHDIGLKALKLKTSAGFLQANSVVVGTGATQEDALADSSLTTLCAISAEVGQITLTSGGLEQFVSVRYTAGFAPQSSPNPEGMFDLTLVPNWLCKAAELKALAIMSTAPELSNKENGKLIDGKGFDRQYAMMTQAKVRYLPGSRPPLP